MIDQFQHFAALLTSLLTIMGVVIAILVIYLRTKFVSKEDFEKLKDDHVANGAGIIQIDKKLIALSKDIVHMGERVQETVKHNAERVMDKVDGIEKRVEKIEDR